MAVPPICRRSCGNCCISWTKPWPSSRAKKVGGGHPDFIEEQFRGIVRLQPDLVEIAAAFETFLPVSLHDEERSAFCALRRVGLGHDDDKIGKLAIGDERLRSIDDVVIAILLRAGLDTLKVGTCAGLGHGNGADQLAGRHFRQPSLLLLFRAIMKDIGSNDGIVQGYAEPIDTDMADGFEDRALVRIGATCPAIFFRHRGAQKPVFTGQFPDRTVEYFLFFKTVIMRQNLGLEKFRGHVFQHNDIVGLPVGFRNTQYFFRSQTHHKPPEIS